MTYIMRTLARYYEFSLIQFSGNVLVLVQLCTKLGGYCPPSCSPSWPTRSLQPLIGPPYARVYFRRLPITERLANILAKIDSLGLGGRVG